MPSRRPLRRWFALPLAAALLVLAPTMVSAHSELATSDPADGATVEGTPEQIVGTFTKPLADGSSLTLRDAGGNAIATAEFNGADPLRIVIEPPELEPGTYTLQWAAIADDGHAEVERGTVTFTVATAPTPSATPAPEPTASPDASPTPAATAEPTPAASPSPDPDTTGNATESAIIPIVVALAFLGGLGAYLIRRRSARG